MSQGPMLDVGIFGSRDPLPPRIASLAVELTVTPTTKVDQISSEDERNNEVKSLGSSGAASPGVSPSASTSSGIRNSNVVTPQEDIVTEPSATLSAVPIPGAYTHVKWSDLAAFGSQAFQQRATTKDPEVAMPYSIVATIIKYPDLLDALLLNCPDFPTLFALIASCKTVKRAFEQHSQGIIKAMLRPMPQELRYLTVALIGVNGSQIATSASIKMVMETWLGSGPKPLTKRLEVCTSSISSFISDPDQDFNMSHKTLEGIQGRVAPLMSSYDDSSCCHQSDNCGHFSSLRSFAAHTHVAQKHTDSENHQTNPIEIIRNLARSFGAIELFTEVIPKNCVENFADYKTVLSSREGLNHYEVTQWSNNHPLLQQTEWSDVPDDTEWFVDDLPDPEAGPHEIALPLSDGERYRIKRALLRYELFCAVFYLGPDRYYDTRHHPNRYMPVPDYSRRNAFREDQTIFLNDYVNPWEVGELAVVAHFMYDLVRKAYFHKYKDLRYKEAYKSWFGRWGNRHHGRNRHEDHEVVVDEFENHMVWYTSQGLGFLRRIYDDRNEGYSALTEKHCKPRYRPSNFFVPFHECANRHLISSSISSVSWTPRKIWSDTPGMELPSKGWLAKSPTSNDMFGNHDYWGDKWLRKIGYFIWDRD